MSKKRIVFKKKKRKEKVIPSRQKEAELLCPCYQLLRSQGAAPGKGEKVESPT